MGFSNYFFICNVPFVNSYFSQFLFDYAVIAEGGTPKDPAKYLRQLDKYLG